MNIHEIWVYIKNGLPHPTWGEALGLFAGLSTISKFVEDFFGVKSFGNWVFTGIKKFFGAPWAVQKSNEEIKTAIKTMQADILHVKSEVSFNGGRSLKDVVHQSSHLITQMVLEFKKMPEFDDNMLFKMLADGGMHSANKSFLSHFGFTESDISGRNWENWVHPDDREVISDNLDFAIKQVADFRCDFRMRSTSGTYFKCRIWAIPIGDERKISSFIGKIDIIKD